MTRRRRPLWGREQWTRAISRTCSEAGHDPVPCPAHAGEIDQRVEQDELLASEYNLEGGTAYMIEQYTRHDPEPAVAPCVWASMNDDPSGPISKQCAMPAVLAAHRSVYSSSGVHEVRTQILCAIHLERSILKHGQALVTPIGTTNT